MLRQPGAPLDAETRAFMEPRFGAYFDAVRLHGGAEAEASARAVNAHAYTVGHDIVFGSGQHDPRSAQGQRLIAHELTHVMQQSAAAQPSVQRQAATKKPPPSLTEAIEASVSNTPTASEDSKFDDQADKAKTFGWDPEDLAEPDLLAQYTCRTEPDKRKPAARKFTTAEAIGVQNALDDAKATIAHARSNLAQHNIHHVAMARLTFKQPVGFAEIDTGFGAIQSGLNKLKIDSTLTMGTCNDPECNAYPAAAVAWTRDDLSGVVICPAFFTKAAYVQATTMLHEAGHAANLDPNFVPGKEVYCRKDPKVDCDDICPISGPNLIENVDAWAMLAYCVSAVFRRDIDQVAGKRADADLQSARTIAARANANLARHDPRHLALAKEGLGDKADDAMLAANIAGIASALAGMQAETETTGATADDAGCAANAISYTPKNAQTLILCPAYFADTTSRPLVFLTHAGYKSNIAAPKRFGGERCPPNEAFDCAHPCPAAADEKDVGAWARVVYCIGTGG